MAMNEVGDLKLKDIFKDLWQSYNFLEETDEPSNSPTVQDRILKSCSGAARAIEVINMLRLFSDNEQIDEVATNELKYMLLSALLGYFTLKSMQAERLDTVKRAKAHYKDYLRLCSEYGLTNQIVSDDEEVENEADEKPVERVVTPAVRRDNTEATRNAKIARFKEQKATEERLAELYPLVSQDHVDDETKREYYTKLLKRWINFSIGEIESVNSELEILEHMAKMKREGKALKPENPDPPKQPRRPFILTRDAAQKAVFGLGYPSAPVYSLDEFYDRQVELGHIQPGQAQPAPPSDEQLESEDVRKEELKERDDPETRRQTREKDEWKDDHRRGWGNTYNRG